MASDLPLASIVVSFSFASGVLAMLTFLHRQRSKIANNDDEYQNPSRSTARLPSLINMEIFLLFWYLTICTPLMLVFWIYLPHTYGANNIHNMLGSITFVASFVPIYTTHIIRIWLLKLKYALTSLSMLNQLGLVKWKHMRNSIWAKIYHRYKWSHNLKILICGSILFDILLTCIYSLILFTDIGYRIYLNLFVFATLTLCLLIGVYSLRSFNDPFDIFREEIIILLVWLIALIIYAILYILHYFLFSFLTDSQWTIAVTLFGAIAALMSILIHFHFDKKSHQVIKHTTTTLPIIVSTRDGLQTFLKFLVTEVCCPTQLRWFHKLF